MILSFDNLNTLFEKLIKNNDESHCTFFSILHFHRKMITAVQTAMFRIRER